jgi:hypothetical protein
MSAWWNMDHPFPMLNDKRSREAVEAGLRSRFPACHDHSATIDELLRKLKRSESGQEPEPGASVFLAGS